MRNIPSNQIAHAVVKTEVHVNAYQIFRINEECSQAKIHNIMRSLRRMGCSHIRHFNSLHLIEARCDGKRTYSSHEVGEHAVQYLSSIRKQYDNILIPSPMDGETIDRKDKELGLMLTNFSDTDEHIGGSNIASTERWVQRRELSWGLDRIDQKKGRDKQMDLSCFPRLGDGVNIYILDSGCRVTHAEFEGRIKGVAVGRYTTFDDSHGHGTHIAGIAAGFLYGVCKLCNIICVKTLDENNLGTLADVLASVDYVIKDKKKHKSVPGVAVLSLGGAIKTDLLDAGMTALLRAGVIPVVAAGNGRVNACTWTPGRSGSAITVTASNAMDVTRPSSNGGTCVDIAAPGDFISSASFSSDTGTLFMSGTSMAAPHVAGAVGLLLAENPALSMNQLVELLTVDSQMVQDKGARVSYKMLRIKQEDCLWYKRRNAKKSAKQRASSASVPVTHGFFEAMASPSPTSSPTMTPSPSHSPTPSVSPTTSQSSRPSSTATPSPSSSKTPTLSPHNVFTLGASSTTGSTHPHQESKNGNACSCDSKLPFEEDIANTGKVATANPSREVLRENVGRDLRYSFLSHPGPIMFDSRQPGVDVSSYKTAHWNNIWEATQASALENMGRTLRMENSTMTKGNDTQVREKLIMSESPFEFSVDAMTEDDDVQDLSIRGQVGQVNSSYEMGHTMFISTKQSPIRCTSVSFTRHFRSVKDMQVMGTIERKDERFSDTLPAATLVIEDISTDGMNICMYTSSDGDYYVEEVDVNWLVIEGNNIWLNSGSRLFSKQLSLWEGDCENVDLKRISLKDTKVIPGVSVRRKQESVREESGLAKWIERYSNADMFLFCLQKVMRKGNKMVQAKKISSTSSSYFLVREHIGNDVRVVTGSITFPSWQPGLKCRGVQFQQTLTPLKPLVFSGIEHAIYHGNAYSGDADVSWIGNVTESGFTVCLQEVGKVWENSLGFYSEATVHWVAIFETQEG